MISFLEHFVLAIPLQTLSWKLSCCTFTFSWLCPSLRSIYNRKDIFRHSDAPYSSNQWFSSKIQITLSIDGGWISILNRKPWIWDSRYSIEATCRAVPPSSGAGGRCRSCGSNRSCGRAYKCGLPTMQIHDHVPLAGLAPVVHKHRTTSEGSPRQYVSMLTDSHYLIILTDSHYLLMLTDSHYVFMP